MRTRSAPTGAIVGLADTAAAPTRTIEDLLSEAGYLRSQTRILAEDSSQLYEQTNQFHDETIDRLFRTKTADRARTSLPALLQQLGDLGFAWRDVARLARVSVPALRKWRAGAPATGDNHRRVAEVVAFCEIVSDHFLSADVARWLEVPLVAEAPITGIDLLADGRFDLLFRLASDSQADPEYLLEEFQPGWREAFASDIEIFDAPDGGKGLRLRGDLKPFVDKLEAPESVDQLYLARGVDVVLERPLLTGDVVSGIEIPGLDDGAQLAIVLTHPCSMRADGVNLAPRILMARVKRSTAVSLSAWPEGHYGVMPLPSLEGDNEHFAARFDAIGLVQGSLIEPTRRIACLSRRGINLVQQRLVWNLTRFAVPTHRLDDVCAQVFEEADLLEEWVLDAVDHGEVPVQAAHAFHEWIRSVDSSGTSRQAQLADPQRVAGIRRDLRRERERRRRRTQ